MDNFNYYIEKLSDNISLTEDESSSAFEIIMSGRASNIQISAFLIALKTKGESINEITGAVKVIRSKSIKINAPKNAIDSCGTGGDAKGSYNISTSIGSDISLRYTSLSVIMDKFAL